MPISGVVITCQAGRAKELSRSLNCIPGVEIHDSTDDSTLVAVLEAATVTAEVELTKELMASEGVLDVQLAYHNFEDQPA
jgi:nitrate reductase NapD